MDVAALDACISEAGAENVPVVMLTVTKHGLMMFDVMMSWFAVMLMES